MEDGRVLSGGGAFAAASVARQPAGEQMRPKELVSAHAIDSRESNTRNVTAKMRNLRTKYNNFL